MTRDPLGKGSDPVANFYRYVRGNPISLTDPSGLWTVEIGVTVNVEIGSFALQYGAGIAVDGNGNVGTYSTGGVGAGAGAGASGGVSFGGSNAPTICDLRGLFVNYGGAAGAGANAGAGTFVGTTADGTPVIGAEVTAGTGAGGGASVNFTNTTVNVIGQF
ncbi:MAG: hypothetical protein ACRETM_01900 [Stenotrophobium sp.]